MIYRINNEKRVKSTGSQKLAMQSFPQFTFVPGAGSDAIWLGYLTPRAMTYRIQITYYDHVPRVYVEDPAIHPDAPHRNADGSLGLYYPPDGSWTPKKLIAQTIVPWACEWLYLYELWSVTGNWADPSVSPEQIARDRAAGFLP